MYVIFIDFFNKLYSTCRRSHNFIDRERYFGKINIIDLLLVTIDARCFVRRWTKGGGDS